MFVDISGFTALSERLARKGRIGAEELTSVLNRVFEQMLDVVYQRGGSLLKFGGDALLLLFSTKDHVTQACAATVEMRSALRSASRQPTSVGRINLRMSSGIHAGPVDLFLVGDSHRELIVTGPAASVTTEMEGTAEAGEIVVSDAVRRAVPHDFIGEARGHGWLLRKRKINHARPASAGRRSPHTDRAALPSLVPTGLREHLASGMDDSEHRIASIAFVKYAGVDSLMSEEGPEPVAHQIDRLVTIVQEATDREGITFLGTDIDADGGKFILAAGVPSSRHDDEGRILRAVQRIVSSDLRLSLRAGVNRGHVYSANVGTTFRRTYTVMGDTVNLAARLMAAAEPGRLYATPSALNLSSTLFRTEPLEAFYVKGKEHPVQAFDVFEETGVRPPETTTELPFRGREAELEMLVGIVNTCSRVGRGGIMTISGDTGVGKSRLISEVLERCSGMDTLMIQAEPSGVDNPYWAFRDPLRRFLGIARGSQPEMSSQLASAIAQRAPGLDWAVPLLGDVMHIDVDDNEKTAVIDPRFRPERTADVLVELLSAGYSRPVALVAEDGQWLDEASTKLLQRVGIAAADHPWTVLVTVRRPESDFESMGEEIALSPLDDETMREIVIEVTRATPLRPHELDAIVSKAGGNPLFLGEILRVVAETGSVEELPDSLDAVISREIDTLAPLPRQLLRYSSVLGRRFRRPVLNEFLGPEQVKVDDATVRELGRFIVDEGEGRLAFRHSVVHDIAYASLPYAKRRELHARAGDVIEKRAGNDPDSVAEYLSTHYSQSGEYDKAWRYSQIAAEKAKRAYANAEAEAHYERAIGAAQKLGTIDRLEIAEAWKQLGVVCELSGKLETARDAFLKALQLSDEPEWLVDLRIRRADAWLNSRRIAQAKRELTMARKSVVIDQSEPMSARLQARIASFEGGVHIAAGDPKAAHDAAEKAIELARRAGEEEALARAFMIYDLSSSQLGADPPGFTSEAVGIYQRLGLLDRSSQAMNNLGFYAYFRGDWDEAVTWYRKGVKDSDRAGNAVKAAVMRANIAEVLIGQRRYRDVPALVDEADRVLRASNAVQWLPLVELQIARLETALGTPDLAAKRLSPMFHDQIEGRPSNWTADIGVSLAEAFFLTGDYEEALRVVDLLASALPNLRDETQASLSRIRGMLMARNDGLSDAEHFFSEGLRLAEKAGSRYEELLIGEERLAAQRRAQIPVDPIDEKRLAGLRRLLKVEAQEPTR